MTTPNRKAWTKILISEDGKTAQAYYKGVWLTVPLRIPFWQWCECELAELQRSRTVIAPMPDDMDAKLERFVTAEVEKLLKNQSMTPGATFAARARL